MRSKNVSALALTVALLSSVLVCAVGTTTILLGVLLFLLALPPTTDYMVGERTFFSIRNSFALGYFNAFGVSTIYSLAIGVRHLDLMTLQAFLPWVLACAILGLLCYYIGYYSRAGQLLAAAAPRLKGVREERRFSTLAITCLFGAILCLTAIVVTSGGVLDYISHLYKINDVLQGRDYLLIGAQSLIGLAPVLAYMGMIEGRGLSARLTFALVCGGTVSASLLLGYRGGIAQLALYLLLVRYYLARRKTRNGSLVLAGMVTALFLILPFYSVLRDLQLRRSVTLRDYLTIAYENTKYRDMIPMLCQRFYGDESMAFLLDKVGRITQPQYGKTLFTIFIEPIPRSIWSEKPLSVGFEFTRFFTPGAYGNRKVASITTLPGELYWNFLWWGLVGGMFAAGVASRVGDEFLRRNLNASGVLIYLAGFRYAMAINEGSIAGHAISDFFALLIPAWICYRLLTSRVSNAATPFQSKKAVLGL